jgi:hypothetical protein
VAGTVLATILLVPLAMTGYMIGTGRWVRSARTTWQVGSVLSVFFFAWYAVLRVAGGSQVLVPFGLLSPALGFGAAWSLAWYRRRTRRRRRSN